MNDIVIALLIIGGGIGIALIFEPSRDYIIDTFEYIISFEWLGDTWEFITGIFDNLGEFSVWGLIMGMGSFALVYALRTRMLHPFLEYMTKPEALFWTVATYITCFVLGYLIGKGFSD